MKASIKTAAIVLGALFVINNYGPAKRLFNGDVSRNELADSFWNRG